MRATSMRRLVGTAATLTLLGSMMLATAGGVAASPPNWVMNAKNLPTTVANGSAAGFDVTIVNNGPSNISNLFLVTKIGDTPAYLTSSRTGACNEAVLSGPLRCSFGALVAGEEVSIRVAYGTPLTGSSFNPGFQANTSGATFSDVKGQSHGDTLEPTGFSATVLLTDKNFAGGFALDTGVVGTNPALGKRNIQATSVKPPQAGIVATVQDGLAAAEFSCTTCAGTLFGEWSSVHVNNGAPFTSLFPVSLLVYGQAVPNSATTSSINVAHVLDNLTSSYVISDRCTSATPTGNECITVTKVGNDFQIVVWLHENGGLRGLS